MASIYLRGNIYWVKLGHPEGGRQVSFSLETSDQARAGLLAQVAQARFDLLRPALRDLPLPVRVLDFLGETGVPTIISALIPVATPAPTVEANAPSVIPAQLRIPIRKVLAEYTGYVRSENAPRHASNKLAHLRRYFGCGLMGEPARKSEKEEGKDKIRFQGNCLEDVKVEDVRLYIEELEIGVKTRRHYRETFHHLFEHAMKCNYFIPTNFRYPNPMFALPSYLSKNEVIRFLSEKEKENLYALLAPHPSLLAGTRLMVEAGLRRAEALWLTRRAISNDLSYMSIVNQADPESDLESSLKTGSRPVTILPPLREFLKGYLPSLAGDWLVPSPTGKQWHGDNFGDAHRGVLRPAGLDHIGKDG
jgi:integrase